MHIWRNGIQVRQSAGLLLKNNLKAQYAATTEEFRKYIKVGPWCTPGNWVLDCPHMMSVQCKAVGWF